MNTIGGLITERAPAPTKMMSPDYLKHPIGNFTVECKLIIAASNTTIGKRMSTLI